MEVTLSGMPMDEQVRGHIPNSNLRSPSETLTQSCSEPSQRESFVEDIVRIQLVHLPT